MGAVRSHSGPADFCRREAFGKAVGVLVDAEEHRIGMISVSRVSGPAAGWSPCRMAESASPVTKRVEVRVWGPVASTLRMPGSICAELRKGSSGPKIDVTSQSVPSFPGVQSSMLIPFRM